MVTEKQLESIHADLTALLEQCKSQRENPTIIRIIEVLVRLTNPAAESEQPATAEPDQPAADQEGHSVTAADTVEPCPHKAVNIYGICTVCGQCTHPFKHDGICPSCGATFPADEVPA